MSIEFQINHRQQVHGSPQRDLNHDTIDKRPSIMVGYLWIERR